jgi:hypothetical protein
MRFLLGVVVVFLLGGAGSLRAADVAKLIDCPSRLPSKLETQDGMFRTHFVCDRLLLEIPTGMLDRDLLLNTEFVALSTGTDYAAPGVLVYNRVVRFVRRRAKIDLFSLRFEVSAREAPRLQHAVKAAQLPTALMSFDILGEGEQGAPIIDVTPLFVSDVPEGIALGFKKRFAMDSIDATRSYIERVKAFPNNVRVYYYQTWDADPKQVMETLLPEQPSGDTSAGFAFAANFLLLPAHPMRPRYWDARVGYYSRDFQEYGNGQAGGVTRGFIERFRLQKRNRAAAISDPIRPIVFYIGREVPDQWRPYIKRAIEDWQPAFEHAGFRNAIVARDAPGEQEDPAWDPDDVRYNVIRWAPSMRQNALGSVNVDPRSGEIISSHTLLWHDVLKMLETWYFVQVSPLDVRAQRLPLPEDLMGELLRFVVSHEISHTLGLRHNFKAPSMITTRELRDPGYTRKWGTAASLTSYARFNYVAQPGDDAGLLPRLGPYDYFAVEWGYREFGDNWTADTELPLLDRIAARQVDEPWLRFGGEDDAAQFDPTVSKNALAGDPIEAADLGMRNVDRVMDLIVPATTSLGGDYQRLRELYEALILQRHRELVHVARLVGGVVETRYHARRGGLPFAPVPPQEQERAVRFLVERAFPTPTRLLDPDVLKRIVPTGDATPLQGSSLELLRRLIDPGVFHRLVEAAGGGESYLPIDLLRDLNAGILLELTAEQPRIDAFRRELQRNYIGVLLASEVPPVDAPPERAGDGAVDAPNPPLRTGYYSDLADLGRGRQAVREPPSEFYTSVRAAVLDLQGGIARALPATQDPPTRAHLQALDAQLQAWLGAGQPQQTMPQPAPTAPAAR